MLVKLLSISYPFEPPIAFKLNISTSNFFCFGPNNLGVMPNDTGMRLANSETANGWTGIVLNLIVPHLNKPAHVNSGRIGRWSSHGKVLTDRCKWWTSAIDVMTRLALISPSLGSDGKLIIPNKFLHISCWWLSTSNSKSFLSLCNFAPQFIVFCNNFILLFLGQAISAYFVVASRSHSLIDAHWVVFAITFSTLYVKFSRNFAAVTGW